MPKLDVETAPVRSGSSYPEPFSHGNAGKIRRALGDAGGLTQFGVNLSTLPPGGQSALRHWHEQEDEFVMVVSGDAVLIDDDGEHRMGPGDCAAFPAGDANGHHLVNRSDADVVILEVGTRAPVETGHYPDDDILGRKGPDGYSFTRKDGSEIT
jgi:uncharacterized cupin superfamily protein